MLVSTSATCTSRWRTSTSLAFYCGVLGFEERARIAHQAAFVSAGGHYHHIRLNTWESRGSTPPPPGYTGLYQPRSGTRIARRWRVPFADSPTPGSHSMVPPMTA
jgi:hypothetical protein